MAYFLSSNGDTNVATHLGLISLRRSTWFELDCGVGMDGMEIAGPGPLLWWWWPMRPGRPPMSSLGTHTSPDDEDEPAGLAAADSTAEADDGEPRRPRAPRPRLMHRSSADGAGERLCWATGTAAGCGDAVPLPPLVFPVPAVLGYECDDRMDPPCNSCGKLE